MKKRKKEKKERKKREKRESDHRKKKERKERREKREKKIERVAFNPFRKEPNLSNKEREKEKKWAIGWENLSNPTKGEEKDR